VNDAAPTPLPEGGSIDLAFKTEIEQQVRSFRLAYPGKFEVEVHPSPPNERAATLRWVIKTADNQRRAIRQYSASGVLPIPDLPVGQVTDPGVEAGLILPRLWQRILQTSMELLTGLVTGKVNPDGSLVEAEGQAPEQSGEQAQDIAQEPEGRIIQTGL